MMILNKREKLILYLTAAVIIFAVIFNFFIAPLLTKNDNLNREVALKKAKLQKYLWLISQKEGIKAEYAKFGPQAPVIGEQQDALVAALSELENLAKNAGIRIVDVRPQLKETKERADSYKEIFIDLRTEGSMNGYIKFLYSLENSLSLLKIKKFQLSAKPGSTSLEGSFSITQLSSN
jgi:hypothetical protein